MRKLIFIIPLFCSVISLKAQTVEVIKWKQMESLINENNGDIKVINFWATWCAPCIKELPYFESVTNSNPSGVKVNLISLDFADQNKKVERFVDKKGIKSRVLLLDETDYNSWIDKVDKSWSGSIPATLVINEKSGKRKFVEGELTQEKLHNLIESIKN